MSNQPAWREQNSETFIEMGKIYTPSRDEMERAILDLVPAHLDDDFEAADLCAGEGWLSRGLLQRYSRARVTVLDGSPTMLTQAEQTLAPFAGRFHTARFRLDMPSDLAEIPMAARCIMSSLAIHHISGPKKRELYKRLWARLATGGALLITDLVAPCNEWEHRAMADAWDRVVRHQSVSLTGSLDAYHRFVADEWNWYRFPDLMDMPSTLPDQLRWLQEAGFRTVDVFWARAGHAIFGGYK